MDGLLAQITSHCHWRKRLPSHLQSAAVAHRARDYLYAHIGDNIGLSDLARETGTDRFTLTRCFKREFHLAPHAWLIQLRLAKARQCLARGEQPVDVAALWALPTKATWGAGSSGHTVFRQPITVGCAQTFQTFPENSVTFMALIKGATCESDPLPAVCFCCLDNAGANQYSGPDQQPAFWCEKYRARHSGRLYCRECHRVDFRGGAGEVLRQYPLIRQVMSWAGVLWLSWMSWQLFSAPAANLSSKSPNRFTAQAAALLQVVNPKTWMMALAVVSLFAPASDNALRDIALMALWFLMISIACLLCWAWLGKAVNRIFRTTVAMVRFQRLMAVCLLVSAWAGMLA
jgi:AraC-like DNA-binding protein